MQHPYLKHLVLLGGGHAQVTVLKEIATARKRGLFSEVQITLISRDMMTPYSGMLPGYFEGRYDEDEINIDLSLLANQAGARFIHKEVQDIDANAQQVMIADRPPISYDILSINIGSQTDWLAIDGAYEHAVPVKPISTLTKRFNPQDDFSSLVIIGGGAAGVEMALAMHHRLVVQSKRNLSITLVHRGPRLVPEFPRRAAELLKKELDKKRIRLFLNTEALKITASHVHLTGRRQIEADKTLLITGSSAPPFIKKSNIATDDKGFIAVDESLRSASHPQIFAAGDIASLPRSKAGVFAVRAGPILAENIKKAILGQPLRYWQPQKKYMALIGTGGNKALLTRGNVTLAPSERAWRLKERIDRKFIQKFSPTLSMDIEKPAIAIQDGETTDPALLPMRCLGCGAKTGFDDLNNAIREAEKFVAQTKRRKLQPIATTSDSYVFTPPLGANIVQSVDMLSAIVSDPHSFGRIAALHAMSDLFASHARPYTALAIVNLPPALTTIKNNDLTQLLAGAMLALNEEGVILAGGHTSEADALQVGFAITGFDQGGTEIKLDSGDALILTKPLGIGIIMAGYRQGLSDGNIWQNAISLMEKSNGRAAKILQQFGRLPMTDVTGFGLARHLMSLLDRLKDKAFSAELWGRSIPLLAGVQELHHKGVKSSLNEKNATSAPVRVIEDNPFPQSMLYDPQTSGGLLAIVPKAEAEDVLNQLRQAGIEASIIGNIMKDNQAEIRLYAHPRD